MERTAFGVSVGVGFAELDEATTRPDPMAAVAAIVIVAVATPRQPREKRVVMNLIMPNLLD